MEFKRNLLAAIILALVLCYQLVWSSPAMVDSRTSTPIGSGGPAIVCCGPATNQAPVGTVTPTSSTTTTT